jgi:hypothetical protein
MELEKFIIKRIQETTNWGWILSLDGDVIDIMVPESKDLKTAEEGIQFMIEIFIKESKYAAKPIKYKIWDKKKEISGISDPGQKTEIISMDEALHNGQVAMHEHRKSKGTKKAGLTDMLSEGMPLEIGTILNPKHEQLIFLNEGYLMEYIEYSHRIDVVGFFQSTCIAIPMSPSNNLMTMGGEASLLTFDTKHAFSLMHQFEEARVYYKRFKEDNFARTDKYFAELKTKTPAERYLLLLEEHPWVLEHVDPEYIASYLKISPEEYQKMIRVE